VGLGCACCDGGSLAACFAWVVGAAGVAVGFGDGDAVGTAAEPPKERCSDRLDWFGALVAGGLGGVSSARGRGGVCSEPAETAASVVGVSLVESKCWAAVIVTVTEAESVK
jgi:hypothetical protein